MPCQLQPWEVEIEDKLRKQREDSAERMLAEHPKFKKLANDRTKMLCKLCRKLEKANMANILPKDVAKWWEEHKKSDAIAKSKVLQEEVSKKEREIAKVKREIRKLYAEGRKILALGGIQSPQNTKQISDLVNKLALLEKS